MQAVILAAGIGKRMQPFTLTRPKPILPVLDKTVIEYNLEALQGVVDEAIIVVGYLGDMIKSRLGSNYKKIKLIYAEQKEQLGSGDALLQAKPLLKDRFILLNGDDIYSPIDIQYCLKHKYCCLSKKVTDPEKWGIFRLEKNQVMEIVEKPKEFVSDLANTQLFVLDKSIFATKLKKSKRGEYEICDYVNALAAKEEVFCETIKDYWLPIGYPWHLLEANVFFLQRENKGSMKGVIEENVTIKGPLFVGEGTVIKSGTYIEGPVWIGKDCVVGPSAYLRPDTIILDKVRTRAEIVDSLLMKGVTAKHNSYIGHSVIGENCNIAAGTITADYRHDGKNNMALINGAKVDSGRRKLGAFIGDKVNTGINTSIYPGRKIWPNKTTLPGEIVTKDIL